MELPPEVQAATKKAIFERLEAHLDAVMAAEDAEIAADDAAGATANTETARAAAGDAGAAGSTVQAKQAPTGYQEYTQKEKEGGDLQPEPL